MASNDAAPHCVRGLVSRYVLTLKGGQMVGSTAHSPPCHPTRLNPRVSSLLASYDVARNMIYQGLAHISHHAIHMHIEPSCLEFDGIS
jgi:hypothetical protein